jgi:hypothetical protein
MVVGALSRAHTAPPAGLLLRLDRPLWRLRALTPQCSSSEQKCSLNLLGRVLHAGQGPACWPRSCIPSYPACAPPQAAQQGGGPGARQAQGELRVTLGSPSQATPGSEAAAGADRPLFEEEGDGEGGTGGAAAAAAGGTPGRLALRRQVLDDVDWGLVSRKVGTRSHVQCLEKWYSQLCPSMVERGALAASLLPPSSCFRVGKGPWQGRLCLVHEACMPGPCGVL